MCAGSPGGSCNDDDPNVFPGAFEQCGGMIDMNCDGFIDECPAPNWTCPALYFGDGEWCDCGCGEDCDDFDPSVFPAPRTCDDAVDQAIAEGPGPGRVSPDGPPPGN